MNPRPSDVESARAIAAHGEGAIGVEEEVAADGDVDPALERADDEVADDTHRDTALCHPRVAQAVPALAP